MRIEYDETKRRKTLDERGLDFADAIDVFEGCHLTVQDTRRDYGETRYQVYGVLDDIVLALVWTPRGDVRRIISMRKASDDERKSYRNALGGPR